VSDDRPQRDLDRDDYERVYAVLMAMDYKLGETSDVRQPLWEYLRDLHEQYGVSTRISPDDLVGDEAAAAEVSFAKIVMEKLQRGETTTNLDRIPIAPTSTCAARGCDQRTATTYCLHHELEQPHA